jgi:hypothetical protein
MSITPQGGTPKAPRLSTEEMQRLFNDGEYWQRMQRGEFVEDHVGYHSVSQENIGVLERHPGARGRTTYYKNILGAKVAEVHYYVLPDDTIIPGKRPIRRDCFTMASFTERNARTSALDGLPPQTKQLMILCNNRRMKTKTSEGGKVALDNFTRTMKALFKVPKSAVIEKPKHKKKRG